jgi:two-component system, cell cycle sensor histidine kinase and response regulator CckA
MGFTEMHGWLSAVAVLLQLAVGIYAFRASRRMGTRKIGWLLLGAFAFLGLIQVFLAFPSDEAAAFWVHSSGREAVLASMSAALLLLAMLHIRRLYAEREAAAMSLQEERNRLQALIDHLPDQIYVKDREGRYVMSNPAHASLLGVGSAGEVVGKTAQDFFSATQAAQFQKDDQRVLDTGVEILNQEASVQDDAGNTRRLLINKVPMRNARGETIGLVGINRDVTGIKAALAEMRASEELYRSLVEVLPQCIIRKDLRGRFTFANPAFCTAVGRSLGDVLGGTDSDLFPPDLAEKYRRDDLHVIQTNRPFEAIEKHVSPKGDKLYVQVVKLPLHGPDGATTGIQAIYWDVTERERAAELAQQHTASMRASIDGMAILDAEGRYIYLNDAHVRVYGYESADQLVGRTWEQLYEADETSRFRETILPRLWERGHWHGEAVGRRRDGVTFPQEVSLSRIVGGGIVCVVRDISDRKAAEQNRLALERKLMETQKLESLGVLAGGIAHDFNNLLTVILGNASLARIGLTNTSPLQSHLESIEKTSLQAADLCKQMLAYAGRGRLQIQPLDLNRLVEDMDQLLQISINKRVVLKYDFATGLPVIEADPSQLRQVLLNLVINASEAIGDRSGVISIRTGIMRADRAYLTETYLSPDLAEGSYVFVEVADNGCGMNAETKARVFDPFFTTKFTGRGLGLAAVLGIVRRHRGAMKVYSEVGRGTTFKFLLPCNEAIARAILDQTRTLPEWRGSGTVLVVDDEETVRSITAQLLESLGFRVLLAPDGREGVRMFREHAADITLVILDMTMPHMNGEEAFTEMRRIRGDARVLLVSGYSEEDATSRFAGKGLAGFLQKPFRTDELREKMREILAPA